MWVYSVANGVTDKARDDDHKNNFNLVASVTRLSLLAIK